MPTKKKKSTTGKKKTKSSSHKTLFKKMAAMISREWKKYTGPLDYAKFTKKMWKEHGKK
jgi:hypothetical protein